MRFVAFVLFLLFSLSNCTKINYDDRGRDRASDNKNRDIPKFEIEDINNLDLNELKDKAKIKTEDCKDYNSGVPSLNLFSDALSKAFGVTNPITAFKNCLAKSIDESLKPLCEAEQNLDRLEKKHRGDDRALDQIDRARNNLENVKASIVDQLWRFADSVDRGYGKRIDKLLDKNEGFEGDIIEFIGDTEFGSFVEFFEYKADTVCFGNINFNR